MAAEIPLSWRRRTNPREVLVVRVPSLHRHKSTMSQKHPSLTIRCVFFMLQLIFVLNVTRLTDVRKNVAVNRLINPFL